MDMEINVLNTLQTYVENGDIVTFVEHFSTDESFRNNAAFIYQKLGNYIYFFMNELPSTDGLITNVLQILMELVQIHRIEHDHLAVYLAKSVLLVITEESSCITNIKRAIHVFNLLIQKSEVLLAVIKDSTLEGFLQILGRRVPFTGDYECQALMFEAMYRISSFENFQIWVHIWFSDAITKNMFMTLDPQKFESNCRTLLNYINRNEPNRRVFSFIAGSVSFGSYQLSEPSGCDLWVDFNYDSQSISFYSSEITFTESANDSELWETILISDSSVKSYSITEKKSEKANEVVLLLNCPCHTLITSSNMLNSAFNSYKVTIVFWDILDIHEHLEKIYGKDKYIEEELVPPDIIEVEEEVPIGLSSEMSSQRKVSNLSDPIPVDACETEGLQDLLSEMPLQRKVSNLSDPILVEACESEEEDTNNNKNQEREKRSSTSSKETDNCEMTSKGNHRRVRLYNLESAPVYDVPPLLSNSNPVIQNSNSNKPFLDIGQENNTYEFEPRVNSPELQDKQNEETVARKVNVKRKSSSSKSVDDTVKVKEIKLFADPSESDDFQEFGKGYSCKRRRGNRFTTSTPANRQTSKRKRKLQESNSHDSESFNRKPAKTPRTSAVKSRNRTKEMLDSSFTITCDKIEVMNDSTVEGQTTLEQNENKVQNKKGSKSNTDTETQSSGVSWMKQKKSSHKFETPKRNYSDWRKSLQEKKKLSVEIIPGSKSSLNEPPHKKKKVISANLPTDPGNKSNSGWSDLENYNLIIEKDTKRHHVLNALAADFQSISTSRNSNKKSFYPHSHTSVNDIDSDFNENSKQQPEIAAETVAIGECITDGLIKTSHGTNGIHNTKSNFEKSSSVERSPYKECNLRNISNDDINDDVFYNQNCLNDDEEITHVIDQDKLNQEEKDKKRENSSKHSEEGTEGTSEVLDDREKVNSYLQEMKCKDFILQRFFKSLTEYSGSQSASIAAPESENVMNLSSLQSGKSPLCGTVSAKLSKNSEFPSEKSNLSILHTPSEKTDFTKKQSTKNKIEAFVDAPKTKKRNVLPSAEKLDKREKYLIGNELAKRMNSRHHANSPDDPTDNRYLDIQRSLDKVMGEKTVPISKELCGSERSFNKKHKYFKKSKDFIDHSFNSLHSKLAPSSIVFSEKDINWFDNITLVLSQDANNLSRRLLATVQKCFSDFVSKMNKLRENIINSSNEFVMPPSPNVSTCELKHCVKNCKIVRYEVEKSLRRMHDVGKQYFEEEEKYFRKIKRKHIKASRKFISKMKGAHQRSIRMLEEKVLLETKFHLKKILKHIKSV